jgi:hypothetical protein
MFKCCVCLGSKSILNDPLVYVCVLPTINTASKLRFHLVRQNLCPVILILLALVESGCHDALTNS